MAYWRLLGVLPQARSREEIRVQSIDGWNPWSFFWSQLDRLPIVVPDPRDPSRSCHVKVYEAPPPAPAAMFAALTLDDSRWFYVPAKQGDPGAFQAGESKYEGFWRRRADDASELPWPVVVANWPARFDFLKALIAREAITARIAYRGYSICRVCGCRNGHESFRAAEWEWPAGFRHYIEAHQIQPTAEFVRFIFGDKDN